MWVSLRVSAIPMAQSVWSNCYPSYQSLTITRIISHHRLRIDNSPGADRISVNWQEVDPTGSEHLAFTPGLLYTHTCMHSFMYIEIIHAVSGDNPADRGDSPTITVRMICFHGLSTIQ